MCCATIDLNRVDAYHCELLRGRVRRAQTTDSLRSSPSFADAFPFGWMRLFFFCVSIPRSVAAVPWQNAHSIWRKLANDQLPQRLSLAKRVDLQDRVRPNLAVQSPHLVAVGSPSRECALTHGCPNLIITLIREP